MKKLLIIPILVVALIAVNYAGYASAKPGCIKGAILGGIAGHFVHHGLVGAAAGCAYGVHKRHVWNRENTRRSSYNSTTGTTYSR